MYLPTVPATGGAAGGSSGSNRVHVCVRARVRRRGECHRVGAVAAPDKAAGGGAAGNDAGTAEDQGRLFRLLLISSHPRRRKTGFALGGVFTLADIFPPTT